MTRTCTSCARPFPLWTMPDFDRDRDTFDTCADCVEMSRLRRERERFARESTGVVQSPFTRRALAGALPAGEVWT